MAHSAKSRLLNSLNRSRTNSPNADEYETAGSFDIHNDQLLHSTVNMDGNTAQMPVHYDGQPSYGGSDAGDESVGGSTEMSIELGRGVKRGARDHDADVSSNIALNFGGDSLYDVTPPSRPRNVSRKSDDLLRRQASIRHATETAKATDTLKRKPSASKQRAASSTLKLNADSDVSLNAEDFPQPTATFNNARNTRFTRSRQTSLARPAAPPPSRFVSAQQQDGTPQRQAVNNPTVHSAVYTSNSFALPDMPDITELVSGVRKDGTPTFARVTSKPRSRFTSASNYRTPSLPDHAPITSIPIPDEEKAIFASLELLKNRVSDLEMENADAVKRAEEYESEIIELRSQLQAERRRPDSALGSDDGDRAAEKARRLEGALRAAETRLDRAERKISVSEIAVKRVTRERDELVTQIGVAYFSNEELKAENEGLRDEVEALREQYQELQDEVERLRREAAESTRSARQEQHAERKRQASQSRRATAAEAREGVRETRDRSPERPVAAPRSKKEVKDVSSRKREVSRRNSEPAEETEEDMASRIAREVQKHRAEAMAAAAKERANQGGRSGSRFQQRRGSLSKRAASAPVEAEPTETESTGRELTQKTRETLNRMAMPAPEEKEDTREMTILSDFPSMDLADLRRRIEEERLTDKAAKKQREKRNVSAPEPQVEATARSGVMPRKSSMRDITAGLDLTSEVVPKSVRVQSPHTSDGASVPAQQTEDEEVGEVSMLSNISKRRHRRAASEAEEGMTSAFILPDITLGTNHAFSGITSAGYSGKSCCVAHTSAVCTACHPSTTFAIPTPVPVTDRATPQDPDITSATIRPSQAPPLALATVIKGLEDEITHLKLALHAQQRRYHAHDPALSKRQRIATKSQIEKLTADVERRSDQVYALYDVLEGQKQAAAAGNGGDDGEGVEETLMSIGIDPAELAGRVGRGGVEGLGDDVSEGNDEELGWEGLSGFGSEEEEKMMIGGRGQRRSAAF